MSANTQPPVTGRREWNKQQKRDRIVAAARALFYEQGYKKTTTQQIARAAHVASGTLFLYAKAKEDLLLLVFYEEHRIIENAQAKGVLREKVDTSVVARTLFRVYYHTMLLWLGSYGDKEQRDADLRDLVHGVLSLASADANA